MNTISNVPLSVLRQDRWDACKAVANAIIGLGYGASPECAVVWREIDGDFGTPTVNDVGEFRSLVLSLPAKNARQSTARQAADDVLRLYAIAAFSRIEECDEEQPVNDDRDLDGGENTGSRDPR